MGGATDFFCSLHGCLSTNFMTNLVELLGYKVTAELEEAGREMGIE